MFISVLNYHALDRGFVEYFADFLRRAPTGPFPVPRLVWWSRPGSVGTIYLTERVSGSIAGILLELAQVRSWVLLKPVELKLTGYAQPGAYKGLGAVCARAGLHDSCTGCTGQWLSEIFSLAPRSPLRHLRLTLDCKAPSNCMQQEAIDNEECTAE